MEVREARVEDIPAIVDLLKLSLGESLMPKSEEYWRWKHMENPFGPSPVLLCWDKRQLIGVRAFMRWQWVRDGQLYNAVRAVDTATHPGYQGKGIFKKLTLSLVDYCKANNDDFVFNTPNRQSKPGYLKMGWREAGRLNIHVEISKPIEVIKNMLRIPGRSGVPSSSTSSCLWHEQIPALLELYKNSVKGMVTNVSLPYLKWRYIDVPVADYFAIAGERPLESGVLIARIKQTRLGRELRITDAFCPGDQPTNVLIQNLRQKKRDWNISYSSISGTLANTKGLVSSFLKASVGPMVTVRELGMQDLTALVQFKDWVPSLGDLELF